MKNSMLVSVVKMENGSYRATFSVDGSLEQSTIGMNRLQALDRAFSEMRKIISKVKETK